MNSWLRVAVVAVAVVAALIIAAVSYAPAEPISSLHATNYVNDFAGVLDATTVAQLNDLCKQVDDKAKAQIAVVTVKTLDGQEIFPYGVALFQAWGIGKKGSDRGMLILLAIQDHKYYTHAGYGLESILPDGKVGGFGRDMVPALKAGDYNGAVTLITTDVANVIAQDAGVTLTGVQPQHRYHRVSSNEDTPPAVAVVVFLIILFVVIGWIFSRFRGGGGTRGGGSGFWSGLLWGLLMSNIGGGRGGFGGGFGGGGGGGFGGGGFGGFGGGSTGGGGAGGSW